MEAERFDRIVRSLTATPVRRRGVLGLLSGLLLSTTTGDAADAKRRRDRRDGRRTKTREVQIAKKNGGSGRKGDGGKGGKGKGGKKGGGSKGGDKGGGNKGGNGSGVGIAGVGCAGGSPSPQEIAAVDRIAQKQVVSGSCRAFVDARLDTREGELNTWGATLPTLIALAEAGSWDQVPSGAGEFCLRLDDFPVGGLSIGYEVRRLAWESSCMPPACLAEYRKLEAKTLTAEAEHVRDIKHLEQNVERLMEPLRQAVRAAARNPRADSVRVPDSYGLELPNTSLPLTYCGSTAELANQALSEAFSPVVTAIVQEALDRCAAKLDRPGGPHQATFDHCDGVCKCRTAARLSATAAQVGNACFCCLDGAQACDEENPCPTCETCVEGCCEPVFCPPCQICEDDECVAAANGRPDPRCPDPCHLCADGECFDPCNEYEPCCGGQCCGGCLTCEDDECVPIDCGECSICNQATGICEPDPTCCPSGAICNNYTFEFHGQEFIQARPGDRIHFTMTVPANSDSLPRDFDWYYADDYEIRPCKDTDPRTGLTQCENDHPARMQIEDVVPGATWREITRGQRITGIPAVWEFDWQVPHDDTPRIYEISFLVAFPSTYTDEGGARSCCHKVRITTTKQLHAETTGWGTVTSDPTGISCSLVERRSDCYEELLIGSTVALTATPAPEATFLGWSGHCTGQEGTTCNLTLDESRRALANFSGTAFVFDMDGQEVIEARPGDHVSFTMTVTAGSDALPVGFDWYYGSDFEIKPCTDTDPREGLVQCENDNTATMDIGDVLPGATWREVIRGDRLQGGQGVWAFDWDMPHDHPAGSQEISFLVTFPTTYGDGGGARSCCHKIRIVTSA